MPSALAAFAQRRPGVHVEVRAGRNYALDEEVKAGQLDLALAFAAADRRGSGELLATMPMLWLARSADAARMHDRAEALPLVLFDHPCLFRQAALRALDDAGIRWRLSLTTPSLPGVWAALRFGLGVTVRTAYRVPQGIAVVEKGLPVLPALELRLLRHDHPSDAAQELAEVLRATVDSRDVGQR